MAQAVVHGLEVIQIDDGQRQGHAQALRLLHLRIGVGAHGAPVGLSGQLVTQREVGQGAAADQGLTGPDAPCGQQQCQRGHRDPQGTLPGRLGFQRQPGGPVSYTHLDVYKRQT